MSTAPSRWQLPRPTPQYNADNERQAREQIENELARCHKRNEEMQPVRFVMTSPDGTRWLMGVSDAGATTWTAL